MIKSITRPTIIKYVDYRKMHWEDTPFTRIAILLPYKYPVPKTKYPMLPFFDEPHTVGVYIADKTGKMLTNWWHVVFFSNLAQFDNQAISDVYWHTDYFLNEEEEENHCKMRKKQAMWRLLQAPIFLSEDGQCQFRKYWDPYTAGIVRFHIKSLSYLVEAGLIGVATERKEEEIRQHFAESITINM